MTRLALILAACLPAAALAQSNQPHNLFSSTRGQADLATMQRLRACGIDAVAEDSNFYQGLAPNFYVVIAGPLSPAAAAAQLERARGCGVQGQTRMVVRRIKPD
jgi:hypothetical protein